MLSYTGDPSLTAMFPTHHGFVHIHSLPSPSTLSPPSDKFSSLRGLTSSGENNLAFKCMRKRLIFETLHLDVEGGVGERRTTPAFSAEQEHAAHGHDHGAGAAVKVQLEAPAPTPAAVAAEAPTQTALSDIPVKKPKQRKKVAFTSDRPDLYDF